MNDHELERRLRAWYRTGVGQDEAAPPALRTDVAAIAGERPWSSTRRLSRGRGLTLLAAAALLLLGGAAAAGSGLLRLPAHVPPQPTALVADESPSPTISPSPSVGPSASLVRPRPPSWTTTGSMGTARLGHAAVLLRDGRVLVAGGLSKECFCAGILTYRSAELYDPTTGSWTATGDMLEPHGFPLALTLLRDGRVLAMGGSPEVYDPTTGTWSATGRMVSSGASANATLLPDGRVLVAGGRGGVSDNCGGCTPRTSAELFDPVRGTWAPAANMTTARADPVVARLSDGRVLVIGGEQPTGISKSPGIATAELYNPATETWTATGRIVDLDVARSATLLPDGRVLVTGTWTASNSLSAELYDPVRGTWSVTGRMRAVGGYGFYTTTPLPDGRVLVTGGPAPSGELYDPVRRTWALYPGGPVPSARNPFSPYTATLLLDGRVLVAGGALPAAGGPTAGDVAVSSVDLFDPGAP